LKKRRIISIYPACHLIPFFGIYAPENAVDARFAIIIFQARQILVIIMTIMEIISRCDLIDNGLGVIPLLQQQKSSIGQNDAASLLSTIVTRLA
jgi:hypothetical protein